MKLLAVGHPSLNLHFLILLRSLIGSFGGLFRANWEIGNCLQVRWQPQMGWFRSGILPAYHYSRMVSLGPCTPVGDTVFSWFFQYKSGMSVRWREPALVSAWVVPTFHLNPAAFLPPFGGVQ